MNGAAGLALILATSAGLAGAATPVCCRLFEIDATPILGDEPIVCGKIPDADNSEETVDERRRATECALAAQSRGHAFVYTYRVLIAPDIDLIVQAVFGTQGERLLLKTGRYAAQNVRNTEVCAQLTVLPDGKLQQLDCHDAYSFFDRMRTRPW